MPWTWVWVSSGSWWWTGRPGVLQSMGSQRVGHDLATKLNWSPRLAIPEDICKINGLFTLLPHLTTSLFYKRTWRSDPTRWLFWHINLPSSWSASFPNKIVFFASKKKKKKNTTVGCHFLFRGIFLTQGSNPHLLHLLHWQVDSLPRSHLGSPLFVPAIGKFTTRFCLATVLKKEYVGDTCWKFHKPSWERIFVPLIFAC